MSRTLALTFSLVFLLSSPAPTHALLKQVFFDPIAPSPQDVLEVSVIGEFPDGCWQFDRIEARLELGLVVVDVYVVDTSDRQSSCPTVIIPYVKSVEVGPLDAGSYLLRVVEHRDSTRVSPTQTIEASLQVSVPTLRPTWSTVKARYSE